VGKFDNQNVIITGSTKGLGEATARLFAKEGASGILITGRNADRGKVVAKDLKASGCNTRFVQANLADADACQHIVAEAQDAFGTIHVLINAAGITLRGTIYDTSIELWDEMMAVNLRAPFIFTQACVNTMRHHNIEGTIVNVISTSAYGGQPFLTPYSTSKGGLATFTKNVAYAVMRHGIRVNGLMLGWMDTPGEDNIQRTFHTDGADWLEDAEKQQPFGRLIKTDEAARAISWLASSDSGLLTGALIDYDQSVIGGGDAPKPAHGEMGTE
jgi:NAD(P)-dependent dehydrogenase (short-subunit alcohol dehydrogenase family)